MSKCLIDTPTVAGQVGSLITYFDRVLCVGEVIVETSGPTFTDRSAEARTEGGTAFNLLAATTENVFVGYDDTFPGLRFKKGTGGTSVTITVEYWNGSAWTAVSGLSDGTSGFSADGEVTWTRPTRAAWAKNQINGGPSMYHVRIKTSTTPGVTPTAEFLVVNWTIYDDAAGTNRKVYKSIGELGTDAIYIDVNDNSRRLHSDASAGAQSATVFSWEDWNAVAHTGTNSCPFSFSNDGYGIVKSNTADATARALHTFVSRDRVLMSISHGITSGFPGNFGFGRLASFVAGDAFPQFVALGNGRGTTFPNSFTRTSNTTSDFSLGTNSGMFVQRAYTGLGNGTDAGAMGFLCVNQENSTAEGLVFPNGPDGSLVTAPFIIVEGNRHLRGMIPELLGLPYTSGAFTHGVDTFTFADGRKFRVIRGYETTAHWSTVAWLAFEDHA